MLLARNFNLIKNLGLIQQSKQLTLLNSKRGFQASCFLQSNKENQINSSENNVRVYYGTLTPQIRAVKVFSLTTSIVGVIAQPVLYDQATKLGSSTPVIFAICGFIGFFTFITPFLIHMITKKYVTELHFNSKTNEYTATIINFFMMKNQITFKTEDVVVPDVPGIFTSFLVKSKNRTRALFVDPRLFDDTTHYIKLMGYDKPIDFKLNLTESEIERIESKKK